jgi:hypothetical protein
MRSEKTTVTSILLVLLIYVFIVGNTSGDLVICIGAKGQIALKPVNHEHSHNHPHIEQDDPSLLEHEHDGHVESPYCKPCIDIPIFIGPTDNRLPIKQVKPNSDTLVSLLETEVIANDSFIPPAVPRRFYSTTNENRFLCSIILLV